GVKGVFRFLERVWRLNSKIKSQKSKLQLKNQKLERLIHKTIKKIDEDLENTKFNTAVSALMILVNEMEKEQAIPITYYQSLLILLSPFAPHITEELWHQLGHEDSIHNQVWPKYDSKLVKEETITLIVQINGKVRDKIEVEADISEEKAKKLTLEREKVKKWIEGKETKKIVFVPGKLINIVV
ncbi:MAG: leucine--tRNA ligase, partial [Candidatus Nealsonbacteria bacterium CG10_big_fil_rev_8_21_14_0_10_36_23]